VTDFSNFICVRRYGLLALLAVLLSACASTPDPTIIDEQADYGPFPQDYQAISKAYLQSQPRRVPLDISTAQFLNTPDKFTYSYSQLGRPDKYGYRVCTMVGTVSGRDTLANFLLINNGEVVAYLHDAGLIELSDEFCDVQTLLLDIKQTAKTVEVAPVVVAPVVMAPVVMAVVPVAAVDTQGFKYLVCRANGAEIFFAFNAEKNQLLEQRDGRVVTTLVMEQLSDSFIIATAAEDTRVSINRVSGAMRYRHAGIESEGKCELASRQQF
jgi:hypothetical protein